MVSVPGIDTTPPSLGASKKRRRKLALAAVAVGALFVSACGVVGGGEGKGLVPGDYTVARIGDVTKSVIVNGNIAPIRTVSLSSPVQAKVERIAVATGDRVQADQFLAEVDTEMLERELANQERQQANAQADAVAGVEQAQAQLNAVQDQINRGVHPAISQAQANLNQAQAAYDAALAGQTPLAMDASANHISKIFGERGSQNPDSTPIQPELHPEALIAPAPPQQEMQRLQQEQAVQAAQNVQRTASSAAISQAYAALQDAYAQLDVAVSQAGLERDQLQSQVDSAWRQAEAAGSTTSDGTLEFQVRSSTIYAPMAGVVTSVDAQEGDLPEGSILSIADDSRLLIRSNVREGDVPSVAAGNRVKFTSSATGRKEFSGKVTRISPAGTANPANAPAPNSGDSSKGSGGDVMFPVEIEVTGDKEGLLLGGSVRAEIITEEEPGALSVPLDAVFEDNGEQKVIILRTENGKRDGSVEERRVETGAENEVDVAVTGGDLKPGDIVINVPDKYKTRIGENIDIKDPNFNPDEVTSVREGSDRGAK